MRSHRVIFTFLPLMLIVSCLRLEEQPIPELQGPVSCTTSVTMQDRYYERDGRWYLWAGEDSSTHFDVSNFQLDICKLRRGTVGREHFQALLDPAFDHISSVRTAFNEHDRVLVLRSGSRTKLYPLRTLRVHELVNDRINGHPVMVVYCFLAELAAVYERTYCSRTFAFAVSGYTYSDLNIEQGLESFVLWDRETESLWWPINDRGISGEFAGARLFRYNTAQWEEMRWGDVLDQFSPSSDTWVLRADQFQDPPSDWPRLTSCN